MRNIATRGSFVPEVPYVINHAGLILTTSPPYWLSIIIRDDGVSSHKMYLDSQLWIKEVGFYKRDCYHHVRFITGNMVCTGSAAEAPSARITPHSKLHRPAITDTTVM